MTDTMSGAFTVNWELFTAEQTPENLRIDRKGQRAWGYKRFTLANLLRFARRCKGEAAINSPFVSVTPASTDSYSSDEDLDAFRPQAQINIPLSESRGITPRIIKRLKQAVGESKAARAIRSTSVLEAIPQGKLSFRYTAPVGANGPVCLIFRINGYTLHHSTLEALNNSEGVKQIIVNLNQTTSLLKVVLR